MKLLLDANLSERIITRIADLYPDVIHVKALELINKENTVIWEYAKTHNLAIVSKDSDFHDLNLLYAYPPKLIYLQIGNNSRVKIVQILRNNFNLINQFINSKSKSILILE